MRFYRFAPAVVCAACALAVAECSLARGFREVDSFRLVAEQVARYADEVGGENVLLVVDIDNTLLAMDHQLGSDQWFEWQTYLLDHKPKSPRLAADNFDGLLAVQGLLFATTHMHPPEPELPKLMRQMQATGIDTVVLTSRGDDFRPATLRELKRNGYDFAARAPDIRLFARNGKGPRESATRFTPYDADHPKRYGLADDDVARFELKRSPRQVSYGDGVMMVAGQHKGAMLLVLLKLIDKQYDAVVFVDDHHRHVANVLDALSRLDCDTTGMRYSGEDARVQEFSYSSKAKRNVTRRWREIDKTLQFFEAASMEAAR